MASLVRALLLCALALGTALAHAENLGTIGPTYPIAEQNLLDHIMATLRQKERSGELQRLQELAQARATQTVRSPKPVPGLSRAASALSF